MPLANLPPYSLAPQQDFHFLKISSVLNKWILSVLQSNDITTSSWFAHQLENNNCGLREMRAEHFTKHLLPKHNPCTTQVDIDLTLIPQNSTHVWCLGKTPTDRDMCWERRKSYQTHKMALHFCLESSFEEIMIYFFRANPHVFAILSCGNNMNSKWLQDCRYSLYIHVVES
jgi:hypothetical protein